MAPGGIGRVCRARGRVCPARGRVCPALGRVCLPSAAPGHHTGGVHQPSASAQEPTWVPIVGVIGPRAASSGVLDAIAEAGGAAVDIVAEICGGRASAPGTEGAGSGPLPSS